MSFKHSTYLLQNSFHLIQNEEAHSHRLVGLLIARCALKWLYNLQLSCYVLVITFHS